MSTQIIIPNIEQEVNYTIATVKFDKQIFIDVITQATEKYIGVELTDENEEQLKTDVLRFNKLKKEFNDKRISIAKLATAPIDILKKDVDSVIAYIDERLKLVNDGFAKKEQVRIDQRKDVCKCIIFEQQEIFKLPDNFKNQIVIKDSYLKKTLFTTPAKLRDDIIEQFNIQKSNWDNQIAAEKLAEMEKQLAIQKGIAEHQANELKKAQEVASIKTAEPIIPESPKIVPSEPEKNAVFSVNLKIECDDQVRLERFVEQIKAQEAKGYKVIQLFDYKD